MEGTGHEQEGNTRWPGTQILRRLCVLIFALFLVGCGDRSGTLTIRDDPGGDIDRYAAYWQRVARSGRMVRIDGVCASSCTLVMSYVPLDRICVTRNAAMGFHLASVNGRPAPKLTRRLVATYPKAVQTWIKKRGGVENMTMEELVLMGGSDLAAVIRPCERYEFALEPPRVS